MIKKLQNAAVALISFFCVLHAAEGNVYTDDNRELFLMPRSAAMAGADAALTPSALPLGNPANLACDSMRSIALSYAQYYQNSFSTSSLSYIGNINDHSGLGVSVSYLLIPDIEMHPTADYQENVPTRTASDLFFRVGYGYAWRLSRIVSFDAGAAVNAERRGLIDYTGYGIGADGGLNFRFNLKSANAATGLIIENLTSSYVRFSSDYAELAYPHLRLNLGWEQDLPYIYGKYSLNFLSPDLLSKEGVNSSENVSDTSGLAQLIPTVKSILQNPLVMLLSGRGGAEYTIMNVVSLRAGLNAGTWSFGGGVHLLNNRATIDLAYLSHADLSPTYKLSVLYRWQ